MKGIAKGYCEGWKLLPEIQIEWSRHGFIIVASYFRSGHQSGLVGWLDSSPIEIQKEIRHDL